MSERAAAIILFAIVALLALGLAAALTSEPVLEVCRCR